MNALGPTDVVFCISGGVALGVLYFVLLLQTVRLHTSHAAPVAIVSLYLARVAAVITTFWAIAQQGAMPLLLALLGFAIARYSVQRWVRLN